MTTESDFGSLVFWLVVSGVGQSMLLVPLLVGLLGTIDRKDSPKVSSFVSLSVQLGGSIASTLLVTLFDRRMYFHSDTLRGFATLARPQVRQLAMHPYGTLQLAQLVQQQAENAGFADAIYGLIPLAVGAVVLSVMLRRAKAASGVASRTRE
jgi:hypothetical protein